MGEQQLATSPESSVIIETADAQPGPSTVLEPAINGDSLIIEESTPFDVPATWAEGSAEERLVGTVQIGRGGMASIHRAFDRQVLRPVALKRVDPERASNMGDAAQLLVEEAQITGQLDHPHIVPVYDLLVGGDGSPMFTMKLVRGQTLSQLIRASAGVSHTATELRRILDVFMKVCDAVAFAHSRGVIHRDLKPDNVMIGSHNQVYVMDWGCALLISRVGPGAGSSTHSEPRVMLPPGSSRRAAPDTVLGTAAYMAPEQACGRIGDIDERTDVYALGAILYEVLTHRPPHLGGSVLDAIRVAQAGRVTPPELVRPGVKLPRGLSQIAMKAMARAPADRYPSVQALRDAVEAFVSGSGRFMPRRFAAGDVLVREGEPGDRAYVLTSGTCEVSRTIAGVSVPLARLGPGDVFGENALIGEERSAATVIALDDVMVTVVTREALESDLGLDSWVGAFVRALAERARTTDKRLHQQDQGTAKVRVIDAARVHLAAAGKRLGGGWVEAPWSSLARVLAETLDLDVALVSEAVTESTTLHVDPAHDAIRCRMGHES